MGESKKDALKVNFDRKLKLEFHASESHQPSVFVSTSKVFLIPEFPSMTAGLLEEKCN